MVAEPLSIKLRCASWQQLSTIYKRDLSRSAMFLKSASPPPLGTPVRIDLTLPSASMIVLTGTVSEHVAVGGLGGRGPGIDIKLATIPQSAMWLIETALAAQSATTPGGAPSGSTAPPPIAGAPTTAPATGPSLRESSRDLSRESGVDEGRDLVNAETELVAALGAELVALSRLNPFQVLGVGYEVTDDEVRAAFGDLTKRYHPDRYARYTSVQLRSLASEIFIIVRDAYRKIGDGAARSQTAASLGRSPMPRAVAIARPVTPRAATAPVMTTAPRAQTSPVISTMAPPPRVATSPVISTSPPPAPLAAPETERRPVLAAPPPILTGTAGDGQAMDLATIDALLDAGKFDQAIAAYRLYAKVHPHDRQARAGVDLSEGMKAMANRDRMEAAQRFEAVLELDPSNERAARELAEMRRQATNERKGLLTKLLGKKD